MLLVTGVHFPRFGCCSFGVSDITRRQFCKHSSWSLVTHTVNRDEQQTLVSDKCRILPLGKKTLQQIFVLHFRHTAMVTLSLIHESRYCPFLSSLLNKTLTAYADKTDKLNYNLYICPYCHQIRSLQQQKQIKLLKMLNVRQTGIILQ